MNRLAKETSPYLLQHAYNPVDWYPWGTEALQRARVEDKPILLSIGYAACHWCHVMEHESFEDKATAQLMNEHFICIKVDREERPDLDEIYMKAVQAMTRHGGWPMTVFLTPDLEPFFGGTYFPSVDRHGLPSFQRVLMGVANAWKDNRLEITQSSRELAQHLRLIRPVDQKAQELDHSIIESAVNRLFDFVDNQWGGLGGAPKFPNPLSLELAMRVASPSSPYNTSLKQAAQNFVTTTLDKMSCGGMHDQIAGGFARYSVDREWLIPHFEKMLYDNALLSRVYLHGAVLTGKQWWKEVAKNCLDFMLQELKSPEGAFYSSLDADSEGMEGKFYAWTPSQITAILKGEADFACSIYGITDSGNFEHNLSIPHLTALPEELAAINNLSIEDFSRRLNAIRNKLRQARNLRVPPGRDEKVLTSWNALAISSFVEGYKVLKDKRYHQAAVDAARFLLSTLQTKGRLLRVWAKGIARLNGYLDDYVFLIQALLDLSTVDFDPSWLAHASNLADRVLEHFMDAENGEFFYTSNDHEKLLFRPKNFFDGSIPSGTSVATMSFLRLARLTSQDHYRKVAESVLRLYAPLMVKVPDQFANLLCALDFYLAPPVELVLSADPTDTIWHALFEIISQFYLPNCISLLHNYQIEKSISPLTAERKGINGQPTVYICHNYTCQDPITSASILQEKLAGIAGLPIRILQ